MSTEQDTPTAGQDGRPADQQFVTFSVADETFAVPMAPVQEIIRVPDVAQLPLAPAALQGLANLRGRVLPIVSLRRLFGLAERELDDATRAVVIQIGQPLGFVVDRVASVVSVPAHQIEPAARVRSIIDTEAFAGVINRGDQGTGPADRLMPILDFDRLVARQFAAGARADAVGLGNGSAAVGGQPATLGAEGGDGADGELRVVSFVVAGQEYAIRIDEVQEIVQRPERVTTVPNAPHHVMGLMSLRQRLLPLVSLRALFGLPPVAVDEQHRVVVVGLPGGAHVGLVTDTVKEVLGVPLAQADRVPDALTRGDELAELSSICRLDDGRRLVSVIDTGRLLGLQAMQQAMQAAQAAHTPQDPTDAAAGGQPGNDPMTHHHVAADDDLQVVIFRLDAEEFGVPITSVQEIVRVPEVLTRVPRTPDFVEGVINLRGTVLPVIDQRKRLGLPAVPRSDRQRIMVYALGGMRTGFIVDSVAEVLRVPRSAIAPSPDLGGDASRLIARVARIDGNRRLVMLIEPEQLLGAQERCAVAASASGAGGAGRPAADDLPVPLAA